MAMGLQHYPPSVEGVPRGFTAARPAYVAAAVIVLLSLFGYLALYLALIAAAGYLTYVLATLPDLPLSLYGIVARVGLTAMGVMLCAFLIKGLFKRHISHLEQYTEITEPEQPELYAFIRRLCREVGAPFPHRIFLSPDVNAAVFYDSSLLNLVLPVRKNLLIGLGLVQMLTVNELKAVLAHEFGHFAQSTTLLGQYVTVVNRIIAGMVFEEDAWDELMAQWRGVRDFRVALFGWALSVLIWALRWVLKGLFYLINLFHFALSRQMEYQADLVAVSVTGSDALIHALLRLRAGAVAHQLTYHDLHALAARGIFTRDLFYHQGQAERHLRANNDDPDWGRRPKLGEDASQPEYYCSLAGEKPSPFQAHPSLYERERNAKRHYVRSLVDSEAAWVLFRDLDSLRAQVTVDAYEEMGVPPTAELRPAEEVQREIRPEEPETAVEERYGGFYEGRLQSLTPAELETAIAEICARPWLLPRLRQLCRRVYEGELREATLAHRRRLREFRELGALASGQHSARAKSFRFRGQERPLNQAEGLRRSVEAELEQGTQWMAEQERQIVAGHYQMAEMVNRGQGAPLLVRYRFLLAAQEVLRPALGLDRAFYISNVAEQAQGALTPEQSAMVVEAWKTLLDALESIHRLARETVTVDLPEVRSMIPHPPGTPLAVWLELGAPPVRPPTGALPDSWARPRLREELKRVAESLSRLLTECQRAVVAQQEEIAEAWLACAAGTPAASVDPTAGTSA